MNHSYLHFITLRVQMSWHLCRGAKSKKTAFVQSQFQSQHNHYLSEYPQGKFQIINLDYERIGRLYVSESASEIHIIDLIISPNYRKKGIGKKIITDILRDAEKPVRIYLESFNQSIGLFKELGFSMKSDEGIYQLWEHQVSKKHTLGK